MYIGEILRRGTQNLSYIRWSLIGFCVILSTPEKIRRERSKDADTSLLHVQMYR